VIKQAREIEQESGTLMQIPGTEETQSPLMWLRPN
jgi:hypothetical protein